MKHGIKVKKYPDFPAVSGGCSVAFGIGSSTGDNIYSSATVISGLSSIEDITASDSKPVNQLTNQSLNFKEALDKMDELIIKLKDKKRSIPLDLEGYKSINAAYSEFIKDLLDYKYLLTNLKLEDA